MVDPFKTDSEHVKLVLKRFALVRALIVVCVVILCVLLHVKSGSTFQLGTAYLYIILFIALTESLIVAIILATAYSPTIRFSSLLLLADMVLVSAIIMFTGGSMSMFAFLYIAVILSASILLSLNWSLIMATVCSALFLSIVILEHNGYVPLASAFRVQPHPPLVPGDMWAYTGMKLFAFYLTAFLAGYLSRRLGLLQSFHRNILDSFSSGFISVNRDCVVTYINTSGSDLLVRPRSQCLGQPASTVFPVAEKGFSPLEDAIDKEKESHSRETLVSRGDGKKIPVGITVSPLRNESRKIMGAVASFIDLTEFKRMEEKLRRADRLAAIGEMSASLAHTVRNPVASIRGAVQELADNLRPSGPNEQLMSIAIKESDHLSRIIAGFLDFVGAGPCRKEEFDLQELLEEITHTAEEDILQNGSIRILTDCPDRLGNMVGDRTQLKDAVLSIVKNGIEAMPEGGALQVSAAANDNPKQVNIVVSDEGKGLSSDEVEHVFDPFFTTKPHRTGLGMAIAHRIVTSHGGVIDVESAMGKGTIVTIGLPRED